MASEVIKRRLAAILSADVVGYSRLMGADEESTFDTLRQCRQTIDSSIAEKGGRIVATDGDSVLAEFPSAVEAVRGALCAVRSTCRRALPNAISTCPKSAACAFASASISAM